MYGPFKATDVQTPKVEITAPEHLEMQIVQPTGQDELASRDKAIEDLLSAGIRAYETSGPMLGEDRAYEGDGMMSHEGEYVFRAE